MTPSLPGEAVLYILWHREPKPRARWAKVGLYGSRREALAAMKGPGDWSIAPLSNRELAGTIATEGTKHE